MGTALKNLCRENREHLVTVFQSYDHSGILMRRSVEKGLRMTGTDYTDVLLLGWYNYLPSRVIEKAMLLKKEGKIRFIAMSGHNRKLFGRLAADPECPIDIFMVRYNAVHTGAEQDIFPFIPEKDPPGITIYTATAWRKLLNPNKMPDGEAPLTAAECYRFVLSHPACDLCLTGPSTMAQMVENMKALDDGPLICEEKSTIRSIGKHIYGK
jgi:aryl-alcohol dehydrogenase-like predicted oxidoreductase